MPKVLIDFIKERGLHALEDDLSIVIRRHNKYNNLVLMKYNQLDSPMGDPVVQTCRGIILDEDNDWSVVSFPYKKFFNHDEGHAANIDWNSAKIYEKLDGSLMTLYYYDNQWVVASSGSPDASGPVLGAETTFKDLFWDVWNGLGYKLPNNTNQCFMFELMTLDNRVVVRHPESRLVLHGARRLDNFEELDPVAQAGMNGWEVADIWDVGTLDELITKVNSLDPMEAEGAVVCDANFNRIKIKNWEYCVYSKAQDEFSTRTIIESIAAGKSDDFMPKLLQRFPEYNAEYFNILSKYNRLLGQVEGYYDAVKEISDNKEFALRVKDFHNPHALFAVHNGKYKRFDDFFADARIKHLESWLNVPYKKL